MHAAATAAYLLPVRSWKASCPGTPTPTTSAPGHSHPANPANPRLRTSPRRRPREPATPAIATPAHRTSEYLHGGSPAKGVGRLAGDERGGHEAGTRSTGIAGGTRGGQRTVGRLVGCGGGGAM